jgi:Putative peptidoglycan binding domain
MDDSDQLKGLLQLSQQASRLSNSSRPGGGVVPCANKKAAVELVILDEHDAGLDGIRFQLAMGTMAVSSVSDLGGGVRFDGLDPGSYSASLPELDREAWSLLRQVPLPHALAASAGEVGWNNAGDQAAPSDVKHKVVLGDCIATIAFQFGFAPETVWNHGANEELRSRRTTGWILLPGDVVTVPAKRVGTLDVSTGQRYILRRRGVPEKLRVRFLTVRDEPRAGLRYLLKTHCASGEPIADRSGVTDGKGFLNEPIPPDATTGEILLSGEDGIETYQYALGTLNPNLSDTSGWLERLWNLGFQWTALDRPDDGEVRQQLRFFQVRHQLPVTGEPDAATLDKLEELHRS